MKDSGGGRKKRKRSKGSGKRKGAGRRKRPTGDWAADQITALDHKLRRCILRSLHESDEPSSPARLAKTLEAPLSNVSYHVTVLRGFGTVEKSDEQQVRGTIEHFYVSLVADDPKILAILEATREEDEAK